MKILDSLSGNSVIYASEESNICKQFENTCPVPKNLKLKPGAKVLLCQTVSKRICSGMIGDVLTCDNETVLVGFANGLHHRFIRSTFSYSGIRGIRKQLPLRLAFALTVHRAQGMTLTNVTVHAKKMKRPGQIGVAIGRAKSINGLQVLGFDLKLTIESQPQQVIDFYDRQDGDCSCLTEDEPQLSQETVSVSAISSQNSIAVDDYVPLDVVADFEQLCPRQESECHPEAMSYNQTRLIVMQCQDDLNDFVNFVNKELFIILSVALSKGKMTNKKQTSFFAGFHQLITSQRYEESVNKLFNAPPTKAMFSVAYTIALTIRDKMVKENIVIDDKIEAFLPAASSDIAMSNIKYIAGFCIFGARKRRQAVVRKTIKSKRSKMDPIAFDYEVSLLEGLEDTSLSSEFNSEIERKQYKGGHLFVPNIEVVYFFNYINGMVREYETVSNLEKAGSDFYQRIKENVLNRPETKQRFHLLFKTLDDHEFLTGKENKEDLHALSVERLLLDCLELFLNMSARAFRKEYVRLKGIQQEEARRKQIKIRGVPRKMTVEQNDSTDVCIETNQVEDCVCIVCDTEAGDDTICCDSCNVWCHFECVQIEKQSIQTIDKWFCPICVAKI